MLCVSRHWAFLFRVTNMAWLNLEEFIERRSGDREPLLDLYWHCMLLPFGGDTDYVETVNIPFPSINMKPLFGGGAFVQYPGFQEIAAFDITFYEDVAVRSRRYILNWQSKIRDPNTGAYGLPMNYKRNMSFVLMSGRGASNAEAKVPVMTVTLKNCWPTTSNSLDLVNTGGQPLKLQQNFATEGIIIDGL